MNELPKGFEDLPIGFLQALFEFYRSMENNNPEYNIDEIPVKNIEPSMRSAIIRGDYIAYDVPQPKPTGLKPILNSEIYNFGESLGLHRDKILKILGNNRGKTN
jgi:hypothetical protein